jgi:hypothetical protein
VLCFFFLVVFVFPLVLAVVVNRICFVFIVVGFSLLLCFVFVSCLNVVKKSLGFFPQYLKFFRSLYVRTYNVLFINERKAALTTKMVANCVN